MSLLIKIFLMFAKLSLFSFRGGYVMFSMLIQEIENNKLINIRDLPDIIAIAGMSPGAVAVNAAVGLGFKAAGIQGVIAAFLGIAVPCALIVILVATFFFKIYNHPKVSAALYGLKPVITGIIFYAAVKIALGKGIVAAASNNIIEDGVNFSIQGMHIFEVKSIIIAVLSFIILLKTRIHPIFVIITGGILGVLLF